ncbi:MAG: endonuclease domain-containing protein [Bacteroidetes bacterium]|nr:endonuclease domain-containing protein [Bacteroidota bacterium]
MPPNTISNKPELKPVRQHLRKNQTPAESFLWNALKNKQLAGRKFRRQQSFGSFIVDFYCQSEQLVIELNGSIHDDPLRYQYDEKRKTYLESLGLKVVIIKNDAIFQHIESVLAVILGNFRNR